MSVKMLDFYADWCGPCKKQDPIVEDVEESWVDNQDIEFEKIDIDEQEELAQDFSVRSIPTILIVEYDEDDDEYGEIYERFVGVTQEEDLDQALESVV
jgi:thioredoxin 1